MTEQDMIDQLYTMQQQLLAMRKATDAPIVKQHLWDAERKLYAAWKRLLANRRRRSKPRQEHEARA